MAITVSTAPALLGAGNFRAVAPPLLDPHDRTPVDAVTQFDFDINPKIARAVGGQFAFADPAVISITPNSQVAVGVALTPGLLSHEQFHYDVGTCCARQLARELAAVRRPTAAAVLAEAARLANYHFRTRAGLISRRYDIDSRHGTNAHFQKVWKDRMTAVMGNPRADQIGGFFL